MTPEQELQRAERARQILDDEVFKEAFSEVESALLIGLRQSPFKDEGLREKLCQQYINLHAIHDRLKSFMETGMLAEEQIRRASLQERVNKAWGAFKG